MIKVAIISIGNEILIGKTVNTNLTYLAEKLSLMGIDVDSSVTIKDEEEAIRENLSRFWKEYDIIFSTGGLGPTKDDITKKTIADFFEKEIKFSDKVFSRVKEHFKQRKIKMPNINYEQAEIPEDFTALKNPYGTAPGLFYKEVKKSLFILPGVPHEMKAIFENEIVSLLYKYYKIREFFVKTIHTFGLPESEIAERLEGIEDTDEVKLAFLPQQGRVDLRVYGSNKQQYEKLLNEIESKLADNIWGYDDESIIKKFHNLMIDKKLMFSIAESCTGGLIQKMITNLPGASKYFLGGVVTYSNKSKERLVNVRKETLQKYGAVSEETAQEMVNGVRDLFDSNIAASVTGIAGPEGGTKEKPVGTVHIACLIKDKLHHKKLNLNGSRQLIRNKAAYQLLFLIMDNLD